MAIHNLFATAALHKRVAEMRSPVNLSIHPRSWPTGFSTGREKQNTSAAPSSARRVRIIAAIAEHCARHPADMMARGRLLKLRGAA